MASRLTFAIIIKKSIDRRMDDGGNEHVTAERKCMRNKKKWLVNEIKARVDYVHVSN